MRAARTSSGALCVLVALLAVLPPGAAADAQSVLERPPNVEGTWAPPPGVLRFHFVHRFQVTDPPLSKVLNSPTFLLAAGLPGEVALGVRYASNSVLVAGEPNETELFARWVPLRDMEGGIPDGSLQVAWNRAAESVDGELLLARDLAPLRLLAGVRAFSAFAGEDSQVAWTAGLLWRLRPNLALAGDAASLPGVDEADAAWAVGLQLGIPTTPHSLSLHVSNANTTTLQGASTGVGQRLWGFEFTTPITLSRFFGGGSSGDGGAARARQGAVPENAPVGAVVEMDNALNFLPDTVRIAAGEQVVWRNTSDLMHTVTADASLALEASNVSLPAGAEPFDSGEMAPGDTYERVFTVPGTYEYVCLPHEAAGMVGVVVVTEAPPPS